MERDPQLKQILQSGAKAAPPDFTETVMKRVNGLSENLLPYPPLVPLKWQRAFLVVFGTLTLVTLVLCLVTALTALPVVRWMKSIPIQAFNYNKALVFLLTFWIVFSANAWVEKKLPFRKRAV